MAPFAQDTEVPVAKTRGEIEALVERHGAQRFFSGWVKDRTAGIEFVVQGRLVRFELPLPATDMAVAAIKLWPQYRYKEPPDNTVRAWVDKESRRRWRCLLLAIKAKLEVVSSGIATFEEEFLAHIVTPENRTIYQTLRDQENARLLPALEEGEIT